MHRLISSYSEWHRRYVDADVDANVKKSLNFSQGRLLYTLSNMGYVDLGHVNKDANSDAE